MKKYTIEESMDLLENGNLRFRSNKVIHPNQKFSRLNELVKGQNPFAAILTCSDSRVTPEFIFDRGIGDLFVIRNAGNIVDNTTLGTLEYGVTVLNIPVILVLGHTNCGTISSTVKDIQHTENFISIINKIQPLIDKEVKSVKAIEKTMLKNIKQSVDQITLSSVIKKYIDDKKVQVQGAVYNIKTGKVEFL